MNAPQKSIYARFPRWNRQKIPVWSWFSREPCSCLPTSNTWRKIGGMGASVVAMTQKETWYRLLTGIHPLAPLEGFFTFSCIFRQALYFTNFMCKMMITPTGVARPSTRLMRSVYRQVMDYEIHHYQDCNGRAQRDCQVITTATRFLERFLESLNP